VVAALLVAVVAIVGCQRRDRDQLAIESLLAGSGYANDANAQSYGENDTTVEKGGDGRLGAESYEEIPFVRFRRYIPPDGFSRTLNIQIPAYPGGPDTTALVTITWDVIGELRTMFDTTANPIPIWRKPFHDVSVRKVYLEKYSGRWHIVKLSPLVVATQNARRQPARGRPRFRRGVRPDHVRYDADQGPASQLRAERHRGRHRYGHQQR
jgi:hypothetical protein